MDFNTFLNQYQKKPVDHFQHQVPDNPLLSVCLPTFQHRKFIEECLNSILMQQTNFNYEILIGEDGSTDGNREVCEAYARKHPDKIRLFLHHRENNIQVDGQPTGRFNFTYNWFSARGKYVALCEGDDYWTDPFKLQKQVDFLEVNADFVLTYHPVMVLDKQQLIHDVIADSKFSESESSIYDLAAFGNYMHTPSVVYRNILPELPHEFFEVPIGDFFLYMQLANYGKIKRLNDAMAVYRNRVGIYSDKHSLQKRKAWLQTLNLLIHSQHSPTVKRIMKLRLGDDSEILKNMSTSGFAQLSKHIPAKVLFKSLLFKIFKRG